MATILFSTLGGVASIQEGLLIKSGVWSSEYGNYEHITYSFHYEEPHANSNLHSQDYWTVTRSCEGLKEQNWFIAEAAKY